MPSPPKHQWLSAPNLLIHRRRRHPHLHYFPTRRSSDPRSTTAAPRPTRRGARGPAPLRRDRKSTRLNSSHVSISYAVFCLKKKIEKHTLVPHQLMNE